MRSHRFGASSVLIPLFFNAEMGGLQEHVRAQARGLKRRGFAPTVVCRGGSFSRSLLDEGLPVIETDFEDLSEEADRILALVRPDVVHAHPFRSRQLGLILANRAACPFFVTFHGQHWKGDDVAEWHENSSGLIAVSEGVRDHIITTAPDCASKILVLPNAVDLREFPRRRKENVTGGNFSVLVPSRFDDDKTNLVDLLIDTWRRQAHGDGPDLRWLLAGQGTRLHELREASTTLLTAGDQELIQFLGWQTPPRLRELYRSVDACIAPGRSALESMASEAATFAVGSKGYIGPTWTTLSAGMYSNFGGIRGFERPEGTLYTDLTNLVTTSTAHRLAIGRASRAIVEAFYDQDEIDDRLAALYRIHLAQI